MKNSFCELPELQNPFTPEELFCEEDLNLIYKYDNSNISADKISWTDTTKDYYTGKEYHHKFSGIGYIAHKPTMRKMYEFVNDTFPDTFITKMWDLSGRKIFPCTILVWNTPSDWHMEGRPYPAHSHEIFSYGRFSTVCNFRLLGDDSNSKILFSNGSQRLQEVSSSLAEEYVKQQSTDIVELSTSSGGNVRFRKMMDRVYNEDKSLMVNSANDYFCDATKWEQDLPIVAEKYDFKNPFLLNLSQWHKVCIDNDATRVTLRLMADKDVPFSVWEQMVDDGTFLK